MPFDEAYTSGIANLVGTTVRTNSEEMEYHVDYVRMCAGQLINHAVYGIDTLQYLSLKTCKENKHGWKASCLCEYCMPRGGSVTWQVVLFSPNLRFKSGYIQVTYKFAHQQPPMPISVTAHQHHRPSSSLNHYSLNHVFQQALPFCSMCRTPIMPALS